MKKLIWFAFAVRANTNSSTQACLSLSLTLHFFHVHNLKYTLGDLSRNVSGKELKTQVFSGERSVVETYIQKSPCERDGGRRKKRERE